MKDTQLIRLTLNIKGTHWYVQTQILRTCSVYFVEDV